MNNLKNYIFEKLKISKNTKINSYEYYPRTNNELYDLVRKLVEERGKNANLNDIDTSKITDMSEIFRKIEFDGDISNWDVSNVENMDSMFRDSKFTGKNSNISNWNTRNVKDMNFMFEGSKFNGDISEWDVSNVENMDSMFENSDFTGKNGDISNWDVRNVKTMHHMFSNSLFNSDINKWKPTSLKGSIDTFYNCELKANNHPDWYKKIHPYNYI